MIAQFKQNLRVKLFDDMEGISKNHIDIMNEKIRIHKEEAEVQLASKDS